eukprot:365100-Chlamydomonas_euryale.AAC.10
MLCCAGRLSGAAHIPHVSAFGPGFIACLSVTPCSTLVWRAAPPLCGALPHPCVTPCSFLVWRAA